jgi:hypothetical protein
MFIFVLGLRSYVRTIAILTLACRQGHVSAHRVVKLTRKFTVFFVPLFPVSHRYLSVCSQCGLQLPWDKESAEAAAQQAGLSASATPSPPVDPVAPPLSGGATLFPGSPTTGLEPPRAPAGWYPDPAGEGEWRYWDGAAWTESVRERGGTA